MSMWDVILFDLDGTVTDPKEGITKSAAYALAHFGIQEEPDTLTYFIGPPLSETFQNTFGLSEDQSVEAIRVFRQRYAAVGWAENVPYSGIADCLKHLKAAGKTLMIATSKAEPFARKILKHFGLDVYFDVICGPSFEDLKQSKADVIRRALQLGKVTDVSRTVMVGDRMHDIQGGHEVGMQTIGVLYGYGSVDEHKRHNADHIVESIADLEKLLLS